MARWREVESGARYTATTAMQRYPQLSMDSVHRLPSRVAKKRARSKQPKPAQEPKEEDECAICFADASRTHLCVPCGHKCVCSDCAELVRLQGACPICRTAIVWVCEVFE